MVHHRSPLAGWPVAYRKHNYYNPNGRGSYRSRDCLYRLSYERYQRGVGIPIYGCREIYKINGRRPDQLGVGGYNGGNQHNQRESGHRAHGRKHGGRNYMAAWIMVGYYGVPLNGGVL